MPKSNASLTVAENASFAKNQHAVPVSPQTTIAGDAQTLLDLAIVAITAGFRPGDHLALTDAGGTNISARYNTATGVLALSGTDTLAHYQEALRNVVYFLGDESRSDCVVPSTRRISWAVVDNGGAMSATRTTDLSIIAQSDPASTDPNPGMANGAAEGRPPSEHAVRRQLPPCDLSRRAGGARQSVRSLSPERPARGSRILADLDRPSGLAA